jgi:hypothetical protein
MFCASYPCKSMKTGRVLRQPSKISLLKDLRYGATQDRRFLRNRLSDQFRPSRIIFQITTSMTGWVGKSADFSKLYCKWNERVGRNFWVGGVDKFWNAGPRRKKARSTRSGLENMNGSYRPVSSLLRALSVFVGANRLQIGIEH